VGNRVLVVDDEEAITLLLQVFIEKDGYQVDVANSAAGAMLLMSKQKYHIVLSGIVMPNVDGLELLGEIRRKDPMVQVVMMASSVAMSKVFTALELGAADFILKPLDMDEVRMVIRLCEAKIKRWQGVVRANYRRRQRCSSDSVMSIAKSISIGAS